ncbi:MAG: DUF4276 family protein [Rickettsiales bacterium]|nr:DUF4276 family protein [Rickettsiales bacterium]
MSKTLYFVVEGCCTEQNLCKYFFKPYFNSKGIDFSYFVLKTKQTGSRQAFRGGSISIDKLCNNLGLVQNPNFLVSTLVDYYGFEEINNRSADDLESDLLNAVNKKYVNKYNNFIPYIQKYEIETLLFCSPEITTNYLGIYSNCIERNKQLNELKKALQDKNFEPEEINDSKDTAPSKRIEKIFKYDKGSLDFANIINEIGINKIREMCPRFNVWLEKIEDRIKETMLH